MITAAKDNENKQAFYEYLNDAPKIKDRESVQECGNVREYFQYDKNYPDDSRICREVRELQCFNDFSNLDGFATGGGKGVVEADKLSVSTKLRKKKKSKLKVQS